VKESVPRIGNLLILMANIRKLLWLLGLSPMLAHAAGKNFQINAVHLDGQISWSNAFTSGVCTVEAATQLNGPHGLTAWIPRQNYFTTNSAGTGSLALSAGNNFFRLRAV
jgi:hypothetical protein